MSGYLSSIYSGIYYLVWGESDSQPPSQSPPLIEDIVFLGSEREEKDTWTLLRAPGEPLWHFTYKGGEGVLRISRTDALQEHSIQNYFTLCEARVGGEFYALAEFNSPHVLRTASAICWEEPAQHFRVITQEEVMHYIRNPSKLSGRSFTFYASISEYIPGAKDLQKCIDEGEEFPPKRIVDISQQILQGMADVRRAVPGLMHRDLKPANLLVLPDGTIKILDFGFSKQREPAGLERSICGSPLYMAPQLVLCSQYDEKCDNYSIFSILFRLATRQPYLTAPNTYVFSEVMAQAIQSGKNPRNSLRLKQVKPLLLQELIASLGQANPNERTSIKQALWLAQLIKRLHFPLKALPNVPEIELFAE